MAVSEEQVREALRELRGDDGARSVAAGDGLRTVAVGADGMVDLTIELPPGGARATVERDVKAAVIRVPGVKGVRIDFGDGFPASNPGTGTGAGAPSGRPARPEPGSLTPGVRHVVGVASGKGGVGKSTVAVNLAAALAADGFSVGVLDADIYGPNVPLMTGLAGRQPEVVSVDAPDGSKIDMMEPLRAHGLKIMSMGFLLEDDQPVVWRGPMLNSALRQFLGQVRWGTLDVLLVDLPPGTGDVQISLVQLARLSGVVHVTTPQAVALADVRKGIAMFAQQKVPSLGLIENMAWFEPEGGGARSHVFGEGGGERLAAELGLPFFGGIPLDAKVCAAGDSGTPVVLSHPESAVAAVFRAAAARLAESLAAR